MMPKTTTPPPNDPNDPAVCYHDSADNILYWHCPVCDDTHHIPTTSCWTWNRSITHPTITPTIIIHPLDPIKRCAFTITDGVIYYQSKGRAEGRIEMMEAVKVEVGEVGDAE